MAEIIRSKNCQRWYSNLFVFVFNIFCNVIQSHLIEGMRHIINKCNLEVGKIEQTQAKNLCYTIQYYTKKLR